MTSDFKEIIDQDILRCESELKSGNKLSWRILHTELKSKYGKIIDGFSADLHSLTYDDTGLNTKANIEIMKKKLELFKAMEYVNCYAERAGSITFNNANQFNATFSISFETAKETVENMSALKETEIQEILSKIEELEKIVSSSDRKSQKWEKAKTIIKWVADKGVDVGITLLPLIMKIGQ